MTSISEVHREIILEFVVKSLYSTGVRPSSTKVMQHLSRYFAENPLGTPLAPVIGTNEANLRSDPNAANESAARLILNLIMLYETNKRQGGAIMDLNTLLKTYLDKLVVKRKTLTSRIDDYLLSLYNTDGYYYSVSNEFADLSGTDLYFSNAYIDVSSNKATLPIISSLEADVRTIGDSAIKTYKTTTLSSITAPDSNTELTEVQFSTSGPIENAFDGLSNTAWVIEIEQEDKVELVADVRLTLDPSGRPVGVSRVEFDTFGVTPVQITAEYLEADSFTVSTFGRSVITTDSRAAFIHPSVDTTTIQLRLRKTEPDYTYVRNNKTYYKYLFGAKEIYVSKSIYDRSATFVSQPVVVNRDLGQFIDAVSIDATDEVPAGTSLEYYIAPNNTNAETVEDFTWSRIIPVTAIGDENKIVRFNATTLLSNMIRRSPSGSEYQMIENNNTDPDGKKRNPSPSILANGTVWRIADVGDDQIPETLKLEEGYNTVRVLYKGYRQDHYLTLDNWTNTIKTGQGVNTAYVGIDSGNDFFNGVKVAGSSKSLYVETFVYSTQDRQILVRDCIKTSDASRLWDMKVFLNGEEIADMPKGTHNLPVTWKINQGLNHVVALIDIPPGTSDILRPEWGAIDLMKDDALYNYGTVRLREWTYIDPMSLEEETTTQPLGASAAKYSIINGEIVSRVKPTDNFRLSYSKDNGQGPEAIRLKAELSRNSDDPSVSPSIDAYRVRFQFGSNN